MKKFQLGFVMEDGNRIFMHGNDGRLISAAEQRIVHYIHDWKENDLKNLLYPSIVHRAYDYCDVNETYISTSAVRAQVTAIINLQNETVTVMYDTENHEIYQPEPDKELTFAQIVKGKPI